MGSKQKQTKCDRMKTQWGASNGAGMCQRNIPALLRVPTLSGKELQNRVTIESSSRSEYFHRHYRGQWHYSTSTIGSPPL